MQAIQLMTFSPSTLNRIARRTDIPICSCVGLGWDSRNKESGSVLSSTYQLICYHLGSVAKGSFLVTLVKLPRLILTYIDMKLKRGKEAGSSFAHYGLRCCICCLYCFEKCIKFMNQNAYTVIAMEGHSFCTSAKIAFDALVSNALNLATVNSVGDFILFLGKCIVTAITGFVGLLLMKQNPHLHFYATPTLFICIFAFFIAHSVISLYEFNPLGAKLTSQATPPLPWAAWKRAESS
uniref:Choline transporter-like protein n=1 Tax=Timema tahoe TaxID=61484 RepID=A0A7R9INY5_9NEOP|nr:unnamed protein product [Timema tahoe]